MPVADEATVTVLDIKVACNLLCGGSSVDPAACRGANALRDILLGAAKMRAPVISAKEEVNSHVVSSRPAPRRWRLPENRESVTHKFTIDKTRGYIIVSTYPDGTPGEMFLKIHRAGSMEHGMSDAFALLFSIALQHGIPLKLIVDKFKHLKFEPAGVTDSKTKALRFADSILDYVVRWLEIKFLGGEGL